MNDTAPGREVRTARERLSALGQWYASRPLGGKSTSSLEALVAADTELEAAARATRTELAEEVDRRVGPFERGLLSALVAVPRERFVRPCDIAESSTDTPLLLDDEGLATISAPHAYLLSFRALGLGAGAKLAELGTGSGYGAALASHVVGPSGQVLTIEIDETLARRASRLLATYENVRVVCSDAVSSSAMWQGYDCVSVTFAVERVPEAWIRKLPEGGRLVVPIGEAEGQRLLLIQRQGSEFSSIDHGAVRYVRNRSRKKPSM